jgi:hypothetical protein
MRLAQAIKIRVQPGSAVKAALSVERFCPTDFNPPEQRAAQRALPVCRPSAPRLYRDRRTDASLSGYRLGQMDL